jgi:hypothetical protein
MISVEDLKESLRQQLSALIALYEDDHALRDSLRHGGGGTCEGGGAVAGEPLPPGTLAAAATDGGSAEPRSDDVPGAVRALEIETCLVAFASAIQAAERAELARGEAQRIALAAMDRSAAARSLSATVRRDVQRMLLAAGRTDGGHAGDLDARRITDARSAARLAEAACRGADRHAHVSRQRAETAIAAASAALLAAIQADPARGNPALDPVIARAALAVAERAAADAERSLGDAGGPGSGVVIPFAGSAPDLSRSGRSRE